MRSKLIKLLGSTVVATASPSPSTARHRGDSTSSALRHVGQQSGVFSDGDRQLEHLRHLVRERSDQRLNDGRDN